MPILFIFLIGLLTIIPSGLIPLPKQLVMSLFDVLHFPGGIILGYLLCEKFKNLKVVAGIGIFLIVFVEIIQPYFGRGRDIIDILIGIAGLIVGIRFPKKDLTIISLKVASSLAWCALLLYHCLNLATMHVNSSSFADFSNYFSRKNWQPIDNSFSRLSFVEKDQSISAQVKRIALEPQPERVIYWGVSKFTISLQTLKEKIKGISYEQDYNLLFEARTTDTNAALLNVRADTERSTGYNTRSNGEFEIDGEWQAIQMHINGAYGPLQKIAFFSTDEVDGFELKNIRLQKAH